jgi:thiamine-phosphate pyrophosphorylase
LLLYYITNRLQFPGAEPERCRQLLDKIVEAARCGVDFVQLREKDLAARELEPLAREALKRIRGVGDTTRLLINSRTDIALLTGAEGVHLRSSDVSPKDVRNIWRESSNIPSDPLVAVSCHTDADVTVAEQAGADFVVFGPVFAKKDESSAKPVGLEALRAVCRHKIPVLALGGVTLENAARCLDEGARGIAAIRLFQAGDLAAAVRALRQ